MYFVTSSVVTKTLITINICHPSPLLNKMLYKSGVNELISFASRNKWPKLPYLFAKTDIAVRTNCRAYNVMHSSDWLRVFAPTLLDKVKYIANILMQSASFDANTTI